MDQRRGGARRAGKKRRNHFAAAEIYSRMKLTQLPDDMLVLVMQRLDVKSIFACRLVCQKLSGLALHRDVWRHQSCFKYNDRYLMRCVCGLLRLAPCLQELAVWLPVRGCRPALTSTSCAARVLSVSVGNAAAVQDAAEAVCRQRSLGGLRGIVIEFRTQADASALLAAVAQTPGLGGLRVTAHTDIPWLAAPDTLPASSLKRFQCELRRETVDFANFILAAHAATLEEVEFLHSTFSTPLTWALLGGMQHLRRLKCDGNPGMEAVAACGSLRVLDLTVTHNRLAAAWAADFLRAAVQLRVVRISYEPGIRRADDVGADLVLALASSGRSRVETLALDNSGDQGENAPYLPSLIRALPSLPCLRHLKVDREPDGLLRAIHPDTAPALQSVDVVLGRGECAHAWIHGDAVKAVMSANPSLHVNVEAGAILCGDYDKMMCEGACAVGCHRELEECIRWNEEDYRWGHHLGLFSHDPTEKCSQKHSTEHKRCWILIPQSQ
ncbi:uncharacterized protein LOC127751849 isoform X2 [Frankliniella occidentalis]|uniref:Uncharacterized protein LOC127751849 isoform X2 n=1 Tax=Frankliniella occidentalis TaxID=133901 RepID=A0A9C6XUL5_FRAOC|nr:uncharacterized protein LOC127751849 isoform X2 [Frankliniella occidentalis]